jgi:tRNA A37 threonylcarbamoyltransferase TsaD
MGRSGAPLATAGQAGRKTARAQLDVKAFEAALWSKAPVLAADAAAEAERAKRATVDLHVDLIGVTDEAGHLVAALYDRDRDRVLLVKDGDEIPLLGGARVKKLTLDEVVLRRGEQELALARRRSER